MTKGLLMKIGRLLLLSALSLLPLTLGAQEQKKITLKMEDSSLEAILDAIEQQSEYLFLSDVADMSRVMDVDVENMPVEDALRYIFKDTDITWQIKGTNIYISEKPQERKGNRVSGVITDVTGYPLIGAAVLIKGTTTGASTDLDGRFEFELPVGGG